MDPISAIAASGLRARMEALDMLANNLANGATAGYKNDREWYGLYVSDSVERAGTTDSTQPVIEKQWTDFAQGNLQTTGNPLDLALSGKGFFAVNGPSGALYTRNGSFRLSAAGVLETGDGFAARAVGGDVIRTQGEGAIEISSDGTVKQSGQVLGQVEVASFKDQASLVKQGGSYFKNTDAQNQTVASDVMVYQGKIEASNVVTAESAIRLVGIMRQFEMLHKAISTATDMDRKAVEEVARVG